MQRRQRAADGRNVADCSGLDAKNQNHSEYRNNRGQRSRKLFGDSGKEESDGHRQRHQAGHGDHGAALQKHLLTRGWVGGKELLQLGAEDDDSQTVDKAEHDAFRHQADVLGPFEDANNDLDHARQRYCRKCIFQSMCFDQGNQRHHRGACSA